MTNQPLNAEEMAKQIIGEWGYEEPYWWQPIADNLKAYAAQQNKRLINTLLGLYHNACLSKMHKAHIHGSLKAVGIDANDVTEV